MSIRPIAFDDLPETSFEDMDTTFTREVARNKRQEGQTSPLAKHQGLIPTPSSTTSSDVTIFSNPKGKYSLSSKTDEEEEEDEDEFLNDFQEFQNRKDDFDDALKTYFKLCRSNTSLGKGLTVQNRNPNDLANEFDRKLNIVSRKSRPLRQPRSMMELKSHKKYSGNPPKMPNSLSAGDLRIRSNGTVRFKKSMPTLSNFNPTIEEEEDDVTYRQSEEHNEFEQHHNEYLNDFAEGGEEEDENDFIFDESLMQPQFLSKTSEASPLKLSPSHYDIIRDDTLLTPRLHKRHRDWNNRDSLDSFKEHRPSLGRRRSTKSSSATSRIKIIKQEIDHNTPIKNGRMYYNPKTMTWEGNEQILDKFRKVESIDKKPLLIKTKSQLKNIDEVSNDSYHTASSENISKVKPRKSSTNSRIVGKMMFDEENLRWVSVHNNDDEEDPFAGIQDIAPRSTSPNDTMKLTQHVSPFLRSHSQLLPSGAAKNSADRLNSLATTRYHSMGMINRDTDHTAIDPAFQLNSKLLEKFCHEENRWNRKVGGWFILGNKESESHDLKDVDKAKKHKSFMFEIRNMVINSTRG